MILKLLHSNVEVSLDIIRKSIPPIDGDVEKKRQHDPQEFLIYFLTGLHTERNTITYPPPSNQENAPPNHTLLVDIAKWYWKEYTDRNNSEIVDLFTGQTKHESKCLKCKQSRYKFDQYQTITVTIPGIDENNYDDQNIQKEQFELGKCLQKEFEVTEIEYMCELCKQEETKYEQQQTNSKKGKADKSVRL